MNYISLIKGFGARAAVKIVKYAPHILVGLGVVAVTAGTVEAVKGANQLDDIIEDHKEERERIEENKEMADDKKAIYTKRNEAEELTRLYLRTTGRILKANWKPILLYVSGVACILVSHRMLNARYLGAVASYTGLQKSYNAYRERVIAEQGNEADARYANGMHSETYTVEETDENGNAVTNTVEAKNATSTDDISVYSVFFDEMYSTMWTPNPIQNLDQIVAVERYWNNQFEHRKFVYYCDVLRDLGIWDRLPYEKQKQLAAVGWVWDAGDNHISLGIFDADRPKSPAIKDAIMGYEPSILIDPNIDGFVPELL